MSNADTAPAIRRLLFVADAAVADMDVIALRDPEHTNWQERKLIEHIEERFDLPVTTYVVDPEGHTSTADGPVLLCYDGSEDARHAIRRAAALFPGRHALVATVRQPTAVASSLGFAGEAAGMVNLVEVDRAGAEDGGPPGRRGRRHRQGRRPDGRAAPARGGRSRVEDDRRHRRS